MAGTYSTNFAKPGGYSVAPDSIAELWKQSREFAGIDPQIEVALEENHKITAKNIEDIFGDNFIKNNDIIYIGISASNYQSSPMKNISIMIRRQRFFDAISVSISGDRQPCAVARSEIENILSGCRVWYSGFFRFKHWVAMTSLFMFAVGLISSMVMSRFAPEASWIQSSAVIGVVAVVIIFSMETLGPIMFPKVVFQIGKSGHRGVRAQYWRNTVGVCALLALVIGVIAGVIVEKWK